MAELDKVRREIATTKARVHRGWIELELPDLTVEMQAAKVAVIEADTRLIAVLLARLDELSRSSAEVCGATATRRNGPGRSMSAGRHG
ncbi:hypothetical protein [Methylobacterium sp. GC_Met_2]|uniref:hypothetical protein n=1 Tax=Methylobacterium sp. GC_Met_2 TaxID=2937376 RepID=UPI00226B6C11|nr:hypothetical protein [Methylobacterium sp. GC_Met_2]